MLDNVSTPRSHGWGTMAAVVRSFLISDAMAHVNSPCSTRSLHTYRTENTYVEPKLLDEQFLPLVASSIGHPPLSSASPVNLRLRVGPHALSEKKELGNMS